MERERCAVAALPGHLTAAADDRGDASVERPPKRRVVFLVIRRRHQHVDVATDRLGGGIAEQPFGAAIEGLDGACGIHHNDAVDRRIDDRVEALRTLGRQHGFRAARALGGAELMIGPRDSQSGRHEQAQRHEITWLPNSEARRWRREVPRSRATRPPSPRRQVPDLRTKPRSGSPGKTRDTAHWG